MSISKSQLKIIPCSYHHPHCSINSFCDDCMALLLLDGLKLENIKCLLRGNFIIHLLKCNSNNEIGSFYQILSYSLCTVCTVAC